MSEQTAIVEKPKADAVMSQMNEMKQLAVTLSKSGMIPASLKGKPEDIFVILLTGREMDIPPMQALNGIDVIQGKPCISPQLMLGMINGRVPNALIKFEKLEENEAIVIMARSPEHFQSGAFYKAQWNDAKASALGLLGKDNYKRQKGNMLKWRAVAEAARAIFPDVIKGFYLPDEMDGVKARPVIGAEKAKDLNEKFGIKKEVKDEQPFIEVSSEAVPMEIER